MNLTFLNNITGPNLHLPDFNWQNFLATITTRFENFHNKVIDEFGDNGIIILLLLAFFLGIILIIYVKSILDTFGIGKKTQSSANFFYADDLKNEASVQIAASTERVRTVDEEDEREPLTPKAVSVESDVLESYFLEQEEPSSEHENKEEYDIQSSVSESEILDWQKHNETVINDLPQNLYYQQQKQTLDELICLILNMLGRNVYEKKIAQALYYRTQGGYSEESIMQTIRAVKDFIGLCNSGYFDNLPDREKLPKNNEALYAWANKDNTLCLQLLESLLQQQILKAENLQDTFKEFALAEAANYATLMGNIAFISNRELAYASYEIALQLSPLNMVALSRIGDLYMEDGLINEAAEAYTNVLKYGDKTLYAEQVANAERQLSQYYTAEGSYNEALDMQLSSHRFYQEFGVQNALTEKENQALDIIALQQDENLQSSIFKLLNTNQATAF